MQPRRNQSRAEQTSEDGFMLLAVIVMVFLVLLTLSIAAPRVAKQLKHDRELEAQHRANQYVRAIQLYYRKNNNQYPASIDVLKKTNNIRFLRQEYKDPLTGQADWRLIHVGQNKTTVKDFFGEDFKAPASGGLGSLAGSASGGIGGSQTVNGGGPGGSNSPLSSGLNSGNNPTGASTTGSAGSSGSGPGPTGTSSSGFGSNGSLNSTDASSLKGTGGPIMGIGSSKSGPATLVVNQSTNYEDWEFLYDPRTDVRKAKVNILGGGLTTTGTGSGIGTLGGNGSTGGNNNSVFGGSGSSPTPGSGNTGSNPGSGTTNPRQ